MVRVLIPGTRIISHLPLRVCLLGFVSQIYNMSRCPHQIKTLAEWAFVRIMRTCARSRIHSLSMSLVICAFLFWMMRTTIRANVFPLFLSLSFTSGLTLHGLASLFTTLYHPVVCTIRLQVNEEVTLVYRSWWPRGMPPDEIKCYAVESATESALIWYSSSHKGYPKLDLSTDQARSWTEDFLTFPNENLPNECCPICLERFSSSSRTLKVCNHRYCLDCISEWFARGRLCCPYCRLDQSSCVPVEIWQKQVDSSAPLISISSVEILNDSDSND
jgi:hypothetical protein